MSCIDTYVCSPPHTQTFAKQTQAGFCSSFRNQSPISFRKKKNTVEKEWKWMMLFSSISIPYTSLSFVKIHSRWTWLLLLLKPRGCVAVMLSSTPCHAINSALNGREGEEVFCSFTKFAHSELITRFISGFIHSIQAGQSQLQSTSAFCMALFYVEYILGFDSVVVRLDR